uniref:Uncharacterized protein n=1 Tax=Setaria viridis TaxID=4556 RepID=A0A4V6D5T7_SETVI|nr:hypothetical protein SEVIR_6G228000v2 [Setaria viridis]
MASSSAASTPRGEDMHLEILGMHPNNGSPENIPVLATSTIRLGNASGWKVKWRSSTWNDFAHRRKLTRFSSFPRTWSAGSFLSPSTHPGTIRLFKQPNSYSTISYRATMEPSRRELRNQLGF